MNKTVGWFALFIGSPLAAQTSANDYGDDANWLCRPGRADACVLDQTATRVTPEGMLEVEPWEPHPNPPVDCFYVYPTVSNDPSGNSDMVPGPGENGVVRAQLARFGQICRLYAPMYRQITLAALRANLTGGRMEQDVTLAYRDVVDAWNHYLEHDNRGRGVILIGHSQGTGILEQMIAAEIDGQPVQDRLVSALLIGNNVAVPPDADVGGSFRHIPLCRRAAQVGCVITYMTFRATVPPVDSFFARISGRPGMVAACTNPAALGGGPGELDAYFGGGNFGGEPFEWTDPPSDIETEFVRVRGLVSAECVRKNGYSYLEVTVQADPDDPRADDIPGDLRIAGQVSPFWGLHLIDVGIALGNLLDIVETQAEVWQSRR